MEHPRDELGSSSTGITGIEYDLNTDLFSQFVIISLGWIISLITLRSTSVRFGEIGTATAPISKQAKITSMRF